MSGREDIFLAKGEILRFDGFLKVYGGGKEDTLLPEVEVGQNLPLEAMRAAETFSRPPARYSEASLVRRLEELGIGRPSTYAPTISTIQTRGYVEKGEAEGEPRNLRILKLQNGNLEESVETEKTGADRGKLVPTGIAEVTTDFLVKYFSSIVDYDFTATVEADFDHIAEGSQQWDAMLASFYEKFHPLVGEAEGASRQEVSQARELGLDPKTEKPIMARFGRYGPMLQLGATESEEKPRFATLPVGTTLDTVTLEQALEMFKLPRLVGKTADGQEIKANIGRFGPYIQVDKAFVSIKPLDPLSISLAEARDLYTAKVKADAEKNIADFGTIKVLNGRYGPYITDGKKNAKIPKATDPKKLTEAECKKLLAAAPAKKGGFRRRKKA
jgi:DNA topoisomerase-1